MNDPRERPLLRIRRDERGGAIDFNIDEYTPQKMVLADYVSVERGTQGVRIVFGKAKAFPQEPKGLALSYALEVSFPHFQFCNQLYASFVQPGENGEPIADTIKRAVAENGYEPIDAMAKASSADREGHVRANAGVTVVMQDDVSVDFVHVDPGTVRQAVKRDKVPGDLNGVRVVMSPNVALYFANRVCAVAEELLRKTPGLKRKA